MEKYTFPDHLSNVNITEMVITLTKNSNLDRKSWENCNNLEKYFSFHVLHQLSYKWFDFENRISYDHFLMKTNWFLMFLAKSMLWNDYDMTEISTGKHVAKNN